MKIVLITGVVLLVNDSYALTVPEASIWIEVKDRGDTYLKLRRAVNVVLKS